MTIMVIVSHYFGELDHGVRCLMFGWLAVDMFFVLSGYLIGKLILDRLKHANFFVVFYVRRFCRIIPAYVITVVAVSVIFGAVAESWKDADHAFPLWSYLTFTQNFFFVSSQTIGAHWLAPTWTLGVEEQFYLVIPMVMVYLRRDWLVPVLIGTVIAAVALRFAVYELGIANYMAALVLLPCRADLLACGILGAIMIDAKGIPWPRVDLALRITPLLALVAFVLCRLLDERAAQIIGPLLMSFGCIAFVLGIVRKTPEGKCFDSALLQFFGNNGYCLYLTHLPVLGLMHGLLLGTRPDLVTPAQWLVTLAALPVCVLVGWGMTRLIEEPCTRYGRTWRWSQQLRRNSGLPAVAQAATARNEIA
jgi:peptidoglycan/LPS O-acetylase OafA/YrhL